MNHKIVLFTLGRVVLIEAALLVLPMAVSLLYGERCALSFALTIVLAVVSWQMCLAIIGSLMLILFIPQLVGKRFHSLNSAASAGSVKYQSALPRRASFGQLSQFSAAH